jgi:branched-chain amino acid transport system permease protein
MKITDACQSKILPCAGLLFFIVWPLFHGNADLYCRVMGMTFFYAALAFSWNLYALTGTISLGHAAFFGLGAYGAALADHYWHISPLLTILAGGIAATVYGVIWSVVFRNLRGARFALATLASVEIPRVIIDNWDSLTFGSLGVVGIQNLPSFTFFGLSVDLGTSPKPQYYMLLFFMLAVAVIHGTAFKTRWGWALRAAHEDEIAASGLGVDVQGTRLQALVLSALLTGLCGGLYAHLLGLVEPGLVFSLHISAIPLVLTMFGGRYQTYGPLLGALILYPLDQFLFHSWLPVGHAALYGIVIIIAFLFFPHGVGSWLQQRTRTAWN